MSGISENSGRFLYFYSEINKTYCKAAQGVV